MATKMKVTVQAVWIRSGPGTAHGKVGLVNKGDELTVTEQGGSGNAWCHIDRGWVCSKDADGSSTMSIVAETPPKPVPPVPPPAKPEPQTPAKSPYDPVSYSMYKSTPFEAEKDNFTIRNIMGVLGLPYQFLPSADTRIVKDDESDSAAALGRKYAEKIVTRMPLLLLTPGVPEFLPNSKKDQETVFKAAVQAANGEVPSQMENLFKKNGRYYAMRYAYNEYYNFVNPMLRISASMLGIKNHIFNGIHLDKVNWQNEILPRIQKFTDMADHGAIPFYINSDTQISDSFSNSTGESLLASKVNPISDMGNEINFLLGYGSNAVGADWDAMMQGDISKNIENVQDMIGKFLGGNNILSNLAGHLTTVAAGGRLIFPEIWTDSQFTRSYDITVKLTTPDCDKLSWFFNICVPMMHLIALVSPHSVDANPNGYTAPFLVRGFYKGMFSCDMGIITNMTINKGQEGSWTKEGLPTVVDINFTLKDLYDTMSVTSMTDWKGYNTMSNTALMDYMANMCGININKIEIGRQIDMWFTQNFVNKLTDTITKNLWGNIEQGMLNKIMSIYRNTIG